MGGIILLANCYICMSVFKFSKMTIQLSKRLINVEEYHLMIKAGILTEQDHVELVNGEILNRTPIGSKHVAVVNRINAIINQLIGKNAIVSIQNPVRINEISEPEPDIVILKPDEHFYANQLATAQDTLLIIEVSDSTIDYDREVKLPIYASAGVPEYWIVNLEDNLIEAYHQPNGDVYKFKEIARGEEELSAHALELTVSVKDILG